MSRIVNFAITLAILCTIHVSYQCSPGPDYQPPTVAELTKKAPVVVRGFLTSKGKDVNQFKACLSISHVYKGSGVSSNICVSGFGSTAACLSNPSLRVEYLFFLNKVGNSYQARYDSIHSATHVFNKDTVDGIRDGMCCPNTLKNCDRYQLRCSSFVYGPLRCSCELSLYFKG